ncbi:MAG: tRNA (N6-isopentenyl adenosine(37)-C2)-methylthiotransferase MiaB, partial [Deltaproteobacteria bacterium]|nr:tRNA (N6-isopentenyl adenosine(37)-C2)-methylthiotransferase MiaB [Deltaproteobacteria bacterium]
EADVNDVNTCAVREKAEERVLARAAELGAWKKKRPGTVLAIVGCMAEHLKEGLAERAPTVDVIAGPDSYRRMPALLAEARSREEKAATVFDLKLDKAETYEGLSGAVGGDGVSGFVTIQRGCDKFCTFCVVPFTRGRERGTPPREVLRQVRDFVAAGYREVVLLGQTVNSYAWEDVTFAQLLRAVAAVDGLERVRFTSPYPVDFTADVIAAIADEPKICKYVHLPLQSGSDAVLERMRRGYTVADYRAIVAALRAAMPDIALSTDILCGFSGETDDDHAATLALMRELRFDSAFMFAYSERDLTFAAKKLPDDVPPDTKKRRLAEIVALQEQVSATVFAAHVGRRERVLVHGPSKRDPAQLMGRTDGFKTVILPAGLGAVGQLVDVTISRATMATLFAG